jgi:hypothetical protein
VVTLRHCRSLRGEPLLGHMMTSGSGFSQYPSQVLYEKAVQGFDETRTAK